MDRDEQHIEKNSDSLQQENHPSDDGSMENSDENFVVTQTTNGKAIASLILGILSIVMIFFFPLITPVFGILGLIFGFIALREMKQTFQSGRGLAIAGNICSIIGLVLSGVIILLVIIGIALFMEMDPTPML
ncbi:DUF4190 domain-containing protein [Aliibacillus thermotolerans]|uniref:DUF4190 domain-containing protein n=1 Tax=Aliibacillus thermotolerans TaxID=1834418 RepID=A0ABW0U6U5_9BACI|nr:DUF4190 domain-containing protein [Aliibacillus thermotolerans]MDA3129872.1 DUF4190 domain-containing protein [Aliibacillus thermotolerans]